VLQNARHHLHVTSHAGQTADSPYYEMESIVIEAASTVVNCPSTDPDLIPSLSLSLCRIGAETRAAKPCPRPARTAVGSRQELLHYDAQAPLACLGRPLSSPRQQVITTTLEASRLVDKSWRRDLEMRSRLSSRTRAPLRGP
jgi:hypothetical protein